MRNNKKLAAVLCLSLLFAVSVQAAEKEDKSLFDDQFRDAKASLVLGVEKDRAISTQDNLSTVQSQKDYMAAKIKTLEDQLKVLTARVITLESILKSQNSAPRTPPAATDHKES